MPAYLKISRDCNDVNDNIDIVDYKGESLRLSFAKKGRITLSKVSVPHLTDSTASWFIGIAIKKVAGSTPTYATKVVTLKLSKSFDYSYAKPIAILVIVSALLGVAVSIFAILCFKKQATAGTVNTGSPMQDMSSAEQGQQPSTNQTETSSLLPHFIKPNITCRDVWIVSKQWFLRGPKTYSHTTGIVGFVLMIGAGQFVFANWHLMKEEGDRDNCYYNDFCYRVSSWHDIPLNAMISNLVYFFHGVILAFVVLYLEVDHYVHSTNRNGLPPEQAFSIGYAFAWALIFEGGFSSVYHLCPSKLTFQFDTAYMFVIAGLIVLSLYNGIEMKMYSQDGNESKRPVGSAFFFLYFLVPLFIFNYLGTLRHSETGLPTSLEIPFFVFLALWWLSISSWARWKLGVVFSVENFQIERCKIFWFGLGVIAPVLFFFFWKSNLPQAFLFACIAESIIVNFGTGFCRASILGPIKLKFFCQVLYVVVMVVLWGFALYCFLGKQVTDKVETPEKSRNLNHECTWLEFFDYHDIWHILSSHGLLMMVYFVMFMSLE